MSLPMFFLLVLARSIVAEVYFYPSKSVVTVCGETTLTCDTTTSGPGVLTWSIAAIEKISYFTHDEVPSTQVEIADNIAVQFTAKNNSTLTSVATIKGPSKALNGTVISCADGVGVVRSKVLLIPGLLVPIQLKFKALNFTSATLNWTAPSEISQCVHNYTVLIQGIIAQNSVFNITTTAMAINVTGLIRGEEYIVTVSNVIGNDTIGMTLEVPDTIIDAMAELIISESQIVILDASWKQPYSSRPPVLYYIVTHNVTDIPNNISQEITLDTNITIHGVHLDHFYSIQVTPVNALGCGQPAVRVVGPLRMLIVTATEGSMHTTSCSCAVELGVTLPLCALILVVGCCVTAFVTMKKKRIAYIAKTLLTPKPSFLQSHRTIELDQEPQMMNSNMAYEEQEPGYVDKFHPYNNANTTLVKVPCHVYDQPVKTNK